MHCIGGAASSETLTRPCTLLTGVGFEETNTQWSTPTEAKKYEHIKFLLFQTEALSITRNVVFSIGGWSGFLGKGEVENIYQALITFAHTQGMLAGGTFWLGYLIPITPDHPTVTSLIPQGGYSGDWLKLSTPGTHFTEIWYGPFLGASLEIATHQGLIVSLLYHYHWLTLHHTLFQKNMRSTTMKFHHAYGHEAALKVQTYLFQNIRLGASLHYFYYRKANPTSYNAMREDLAISLHYIYDF